MTIIEVVKPQTPQWKTSDYECTHQMDTICLVWSCITVSGLKTLEISHRSIPVIKSQPFQNTIRNENKYQIMNVHTKWNCLIPILSGLDKNYLFQATVPYK